MVAQLKDGPLSGADLMRVWEAAADSHYTRAFVEAGDGNGLEAYGQAMEQLARASTAIDTTTQAMYLLPWSGQTAPSAGGAQRASVTLQVRRTELLHLPCIVGTEVLFEEVTNAPSDDGPVPLHTGRMYRLVEPLVFAPGEAGPFDVQATAERPGYGFNNPLAGTINTLVQHGAGLANDRATVVKDALVADNRPDTPVPGHVGHYMRFTSGANEGTVKRVQGYGAPLVQQPPNPSNGGSLLLDPVAVAHGTYFGPARLLEAESTSLWSGGARVGRGQVLKALGDPVASVVWRRTEGVTHAGGALTMTGDTSGALLLAVAVDVVGDLAPEQTSAAWQVLPWSAWGLQVHNPETPAGGRSAMLDMLARERDVRRATNEPDPSYAERVHQLADTVCPNAIKRAINRILAPYGLGGCFREVGLPLLPGFFFDRDAFDYDFGVRASDRFKLWLDYGSFRGFFLVGVPPLNWGEFGFPYGDVPLHNAYDAHVAYDGYPVTASQLYKALHSAVDDVRAGGVGWQMYRERLGCF